MPLGRSDLVGQFVLTQREADVPEGWLIRSYGNWCLGHHASLPVWDIRSDGGHTIGSLLGYPVNSEGILLENSADAAVVPFAVDTDAPKAFETNLYQYGGRFAAILFGSRAKRFYLDPFGSLATVYCPEQQIVASTPSAIPLLREDDYDHDLLRELGIPQKPTCWCPFGLTPRRSIERLLPAHYLDFGTWEAKRHWPTGEIEESRDPRKDAMEAVSLIAKNISAVAKQHPLHMSLTAGHDSRMLLACARECLDRVQFFTMAVPGPQGKLDCEIAPRLAKRHGLDYRILPYMQASEQEVVDWQYRVGDCLGGLRGWLVRTRWQLDPSRALLLGMGGELARAFHWRGAADRDGPMTADEVLRYRRIPPAPCRTTAIRRKAQRWLDALPVARHETILDLLYNEDFHGCEWVPEIPGFINAPLILLPFCHQRVVEIMMSLPKEYRQNRQMWADALGTLWPELLELPFNWPIGIRRLVSSFGRRAQAVQRKLATLLQSTGARNVQTK